WVNYALGTDNSNLPAFIVMKSQFQSAGVGATQATWSAGFLPSNHQGVEFRSGNQPVLYVASPDGIDRAERRGQMDFIDEVARTHPGDCWAVDQPSAGLVQDLKQRGLLDDTLVTFKGEFGRTVYSQGQGGITANSGRDHHGGNFTMWMAGGGVKAGAAYGRTD